ncbi:putative major facilitator superfamily protein [Botrytis fragariae]|uniref:Putative major facilitator superfamily protein n=1 Tax=Botrytis fragariae TaxID=1964551 RepID=A0A8H6AZE0_9HELO|nr:putative major facilitator superfamily protein [Botrytis fragariae]KAF5876292.1 putative major facilitator superfamily protein [Botrytis fragariae]
MPPRLFQHRTSAISFLLIFLASTIITAANCFLPVYFQAVNQASPLDSSIYYLSFALAIIPVGGLSAAFISKPGLYISLHAIGFALSPSEPNSSQRYRNLQPRFLDRISNHHTSDAG